MKPILSSVNVIEIEGNQIIGLAAFEQSLSGNEAAEALFGQLASKHGTTNEVEISDAINDSVLTVGEWKVMIVHAVAQPNLMPSFMSSPDREGVCPMCKAKGVAEKGCPTCPGFWFE